MRLRVTARSGLQIQAFAGGVFGENTYLVRSDSTAVVIDPGAAATQVREVMRRDGLSIAAIVLTHAHLDHIEGIPTIEAGMDVPIWLHPADRSLYDAVQSQAAAFGHRVPPLPEPTHVLEVRTAVEFDGMAFEVRHAPGHSPGHVILNLLGEDVVFCGDVVFRGSIGRTDLPGGDHRTLLASIREEVLTLDDNVRLLPGHGPETTVGVERASNPFLAAL